MRPGASSGTGVAEGTGVGSSPEGNGVGDGVDAGIGVQLTAIQRTMIPTKKDLLKSLRTRISPYIKITAG
jgi:hypothetical protein